MNISKRSQYIPYILHFVLHAIGGMNTHGIELVKMTLKYPINLKLNLKLKRYPQLTYVPRVQCTPIIQRLLNIYNKLDFLYDSKIMIKVTNTNELYV